MKNILFLAMILLLSLSLFSQTSIYISPNGTGSGLSIDEPIDFQNGLNLALASSGAQDLRLLQGVYSNTPYTIDFTDISSYEDISVSGGWLPGFLTQEADPSLTTLDGSELHQVISILLADAPVSGDLNFYNLSIINGYSTLSNGAGIQVENGLQEGDAQIALVLDHIHFINNVADNNKSGGAISSGSGLQISNCLFDGNSGSSGGAVHSYSEPFTQNMFRSISNSEFRNNSNYGNQGSSVYVGSTTLYFEDNIFFGMTDGSDSGNGSAIYAVNGYVSINRCKFENIRIKYWASAVQGWNSKMDILNSLFINNKSGILDGFGTIAYYHNNNTEDKLTQIINSTFVGNEAGSGTFASAIHFRGNGGDRIDIYNSIFWDNGTTAIYKESGSANIGWSITENPALGFNEEASVLSDNPLFDAEYNLASNSPAIDAGNDSFVESEWTDLGGGIRTLGNVTDLGAFEFNAPPISIILANTEIEENNLPGIEITSLEADDQSGDQHIFSLIMGDGLNDADNSKFSIIGNMLMLDEVANFEEQNTFFIYLKVADSNNQEAETAFMINVLDINEAPFIVGALIDQEAVVGESLSFTINTDIFNDEDEGDDITFTATLTNGDNLPNWLTFDATTSSFEGTPTLAEVLEIKITAADMFGLTAEDTFTLNILPLGINDFKYNSLSIYPNPSCDYIFLEGNNHDEKFTIFNIEGKLIAEGSLTGNPARIDVSTFDSGIYILVITGKQSQSSSHFSVKK